MKGGEIKFLLLNFLSCSLFPSVATLKREMHARLSRANLLSRSEEKYLARGRTSSVIIRLVAEMHARPARTNLLVEKA